VISGASRPTSNVTFTEYFSIQYTEMHSPRCLRLFYHARYILRSHQNVAATDSLVTRVRSGIVIIFIGHTSSIAWCKVLIKIPLGRPLFIIISNARRPTIVGPDTSARISSGRNEEGFQRFTRKRHRAKIHRKCRNHLNYHASSFDDVESHRRNAKSGIQNALLFSSLPLRAYARVRFPRCNFPSYISPPSARADKFRRGEGRTGEGRRPTAAI